MTYAWIINNVQDPKSTKLTYSKETSMVIVNMFALYSELDVMFIIAGATSQISFFIMIILANMVSISVINWQYISQKEKEYPTEDNDLEQEFVWSIILS